MFASVWSRTVCRNVPTLAGGLAAAVLLASAAEAQLRKDTLRYLDKAESEAALFGIDMQGYSPSYGIRWRECISPEGETLYQVDDTLQNGRLRISEDGLACFAYEDSNFQNESCFATRSKGDGFVFEDAGGGVFVTLSVIRGVRRCAADELVS